MYSGLTSIREHRPYNQGGGSNLNSQMRVIVYLSFPPGSCVISLLPPVLAPSPRAGVGFFISTIYLNL
jgi:hypothetical protein